MPRWCPSCGGEFVRGWPECSTCHVPLTDQPPDRRADRPKRKSSFSPDEPIFLEPRAARTYSDPFIPIWEGPFDEGAVLVRKLEAASIPVDRGEAASSGRLRVEVPRSYIGEAFDVLDRPDVPDSEVTFDVPDDLSTLVEREPYPDEGGMSPLVRGLIAFVAIVLVVVLILA